MVKCRAPEKPIEPPTPAWAEATWEESIHPTGPEETADEKKQRESKEQLERAMSLETKDSMQIDMQLQELKNAAVMRPSLAQLEEERMRFEPVTDFQPHEHDKYRDSVSVHQGNSYYESTKPVEMTKFPAADPKEVTHKPIKNYQWYDDTTFEKSSPTVRWL